jgi:inorganic pyrophosphatase/exopolyphosphatase
VSVTLVDHNQFTLLSQQHPDWTVMKILDHHYLDEGARFLSDGKQTVSTSNT